MPALSDTDTFPLESPEREYDARGFFAIGPKCVNPSDVLAKAMEEAKLALSIYAHDTRFKPDILEERRARRIQNGRDMAARHGRRVRPWEC